jgi:hypothetical protein
VGQRKKQLTERRLADELSRHLASEANAPIAAEKQDLHAREKEAKVLKNAPTNTAGNTSVLSTSFTFRKQITSFPSS